MPRKERRVLVLAERKRRKKAAASSPGEEYAWMARLLPAGGGRVLEVGADPRSTSALRDRGWSVVSIEAAAVLAEGGFGGEPLDAVTCWLLDLRAVRPQAAQKLDAMGLQTDDERRLAVQTLVYRLANRVLRPGGVLQLVDRTREPFGESLAAGMVKLQRAQSRGTALAFSAIDARPDGAGAFVSVRSRKP